MKITVEQLVAHVGCGSVDDIGCCVFCELIRARLNLKAAAARDREALKGLVAKWRELSAHKRIGASRIDTPSGSKLKSEAVSLDSCADELDALLTAERRGQTEDEKR